MKNAFKNAVVGSLKKMNLEVRRIKIGRPEFAAAEEERIIRSHLDRLTEKHRFCVDIGASDGITMSNTYALFSAGWRGLAVECDPLRFGIMGHHYRQFDDAMLCRLRISPDNVVDLLKVCGTPRDFDLLSLDIDSFDYFVLERILASYRPRLACCEINETIPPPLRFTVKYDPQWSWHQDHFFGQSLSQLCGLARRHEYDLVEVHYGNAFLVPRELNSGPALEPSDAYDRGYRNKADRKQRFPWNADVENLLTLDPDMARAAIDRNFAKYAGHYELSIEP